MKAYNIWLTTRCNLKCSYCYEKDKYKDITMQKEDIDTLIDFILQTSENEIVVKFHGGEPLWCIELIDEICSKLGKSNIIIFYSLTTNGTILSKDILKIIQKHRICLSVSIDGNEKTHNLSRVYPNGQGSYLKCVTGIELARSLGIEIRARMTVTIQNYADLYESVISVSRLGVDMIIAEPDYYSIAWTEEMISMIENSIKKIQLILPKEKFVFWDNSMCEKGVCHGGSKEINILSNLDMYPCTAVVGMEDFCLGNIKEKTWNQHVIDLIQNESKKTIDECEGCSFYLSCITRRCRLLNLILTGKSNCASEIICCFENLVYRINTV